MVVTVTGFGQTNCTIRAGLSVSHAFNKNDNKWWRGNASPFVSIGLNRYIFRKIDLGLRVDYTRYKLMSREDLLNSITRYNTVFLDFISLSPNVGYTFSSKRLDYRLYLGMANNIRLRSYKEEIHRVQNTDTFSSIITNDIPVSGYSVGAFCGAEVHTRFGLFAGVEYRPLLQVINYSNTERFNTSMLIFNIGYKLNFKK